MQGLEQLNRAGTNPKRLGSGNLAREAGVNLETVRCGIIHAAPDVGAEKRQSKLATDLSVAFYAVFRAVERRRPQSVTTDGDTLDAQKTARGTENLYLTAVNGAHRRTRNVRGMLSITTTNIEGPRIAERTGKCREI